MGIYSPWDHLLPPELITLKRRRSQNFKKIAENLLPLGTPLLDPFRGLLGPVPGAYFGTSGPATVWGRSAPLRAEVGEGVPRGAIKAPPVGRINGFGPKDDFPRPLLITFGAATAFERNAFFMASALW